MQINVKVDDREVKENFIKLQAKTGDLTPVMRDIGEIIRASIEKNFAAEGRPSHWKKSKRAEAQVGQTLSNSGRLRRSFTVRADSTNVVVGTNVVYAAIHQFGGRTKPSVITPIYAKALKIPGIGFRKRVNHPGSNIPARPFMLIQDEDWGIMKAVILKHLEF